MAVRKGFEPLIRVNVYTLSRRAPSTARTPHRNGVYFTEKFLTIKYKFSLLEFFNDKSREGFENLLKTRKELLHYQSRFKFLCFIFHENFLKTYCESKKISFKKLKNIKKIILYYLTFVSYCYLVFSVVYLTKVSRY